MSRQKGKKRTMPSRKTSTKDQPKQGPPGLVTKVGSAKISFIDVRFRIKNVSDAGVRTVKLEGRLVGYVLYDYCGV